MWRQATIIVEQAMGYSLQHIATVSERQVALEDNPRKLDNYTQTMVSS